MPRVLHKEREVGLLINDTFKFTSFNSFSSGFVSKIPPLLQSKKLYYSSIILLLFSQSQYFFPPIILQAKFVKRDWALNKVWRLIRAFTIIFFIRMTPDNQHEYSSSIRHRITPNISNKYLEIFIN